VLDSYTTARSRLWLRNKFKLMRRKAGIDPAPQFCRYFSVVRLTGTLAIGLAWCPVREPNATYCSIDLSGNIRTSRVLEDQLARAVCAAADVALAWVRAAARGSQVRVRLWLELLFADSGNRTSGMQPAAVTRSRI